MIIVTKLIKGDCLDKIKDIRLHSRNTGRIMDVSHI